MTQPAEIFADIEAQPPLMRVEAIQNYVGQEVKWALTFTDGYESVPGQARLTFRFAPHDIRHVSVNVPLDDYPKLKTTQAGQLMQVHGRISQIGTLGIELQMAELAFCNEPNVIAHQS